ncbi:GAF and ANTAR domain-containing protein [Streptomyces sp. NPDC050610]|uniref:GAF and ANTAR domain-containing protein n=1 Tax=Streptomyces sp. NPDC050610 TaxID=3157097 RepID=UPI0034214C36
MDKRVVAKTFVELAGGLDGALAPSALLRLLSDRCVRVLGADAAGVLLADRAGELRLVAASDEHVRLRELFEVQREEGPSLDCFRKGAAVAVPDVNTEARSRPRFVAQARRCGFTAVHALPLRCRNEVVGVLNLFCVEPRRLGPAGSHIAQAMADVATASFVRQCAIRRGQLVNEQLQTTLNDRIVIEQAKGKLAERLGVDMEQAFATLRGYAQSHRRRLPDAACDVIDDRVAPSAPRD